MISGGIYLLPPPFNPNAFDDDERDLFSGDPYIYFYEDFLKAYSPETRKKRGVYYTPPPVVRFIVTSIDHLLKEKFGIHEGFANHERVTVLDFAVGTGTFLVEIFRHILADIGEGRRESLIDEHILKNLLGFEFLIAPYTIAHLKLSQFLKQNRYNIKQDQRLQIYLTNTLEKINPQISFFLPALAEEVKKAQEIKEKTKILVIIGNPPYSGHSQNKGAWITGEIGKYKYVDGEPIKEKNPKWLQDDYVKFIRFAEHKMEQMAEGIIGIITNHGFLNNPTFRGMRQHLMNTFDQIYLLDLHGNANKREKTPAGDKDENVFDIKQGVSISFFIKKQGLDKGIFHADLYGLREDKYRTLWREAFASVKWQKLMPKSPLYLFIPRDEQHMEEYEKGWAVNEVFIKNSIGIVTARDKLTIHYTEEEMFDTVRDFAALQPEQAREKYDLKRDVCDWKVKWAQEDLRKSGLKKEKITPIAYRPLDMRHTYYTGHSRGFNCRPRADIMHHMLVGDNIGLALSRQVKAGRCWQHCFVTDPIMESTYVSNKTSEGTYLFPLYLYPPAQEKKNLKSRLFEEEDPFAGQSRIENFSTEFRTFIDGFYGKHYPPEKIVGYIYAVLHSPAYRTDYFDFLKRDFPRIPFVESSEHFETLSILGWELIEAHRLKNVPDCIKTDLQGKGTQKVEQCTHSPPNESLIINKTQYFNNVSQEIYEFPIGGYQPLPKYIKSRKGRTLSLHEINTIRDIINVLAFTRTQMEEIDQVYKIATQKPDISPNKC